MFYCIVIAKILFLGLWDFENRVPANQALKLNVILGGLLLQLAILSRFSECVLFLSELSVYKANTMWLNSLIRESNRNELERPIELSNGLFFLSLQKNLLCTCSPQRTFTCIHTKPTTYPLQPSKISKELRIT